MARPAEHPVAQHDRPAVAVVAAGLPVRGAAVVGVLDLDHVPAVRPAVEPALVPHLAFLGHREVEADLQPPGPRHVGEVLLRDRQVRGGGRCLASRRRQREVVAPGRAGGATGCASRGCPARSASKPSRRSARTSGPSPPRCRAAWPPSTCRAAPRRASPRRAPVGRGRAAAGAGGGCATSAAGPAGSGRR